MAFITITKQLQMHNLLLHYQCSDISPSSKSKYNFACGQISTDFINVALSLFTEPDSALKKFLELTSKMTPEERASFLEKDEVRKKSFAQVCDDEVVRGSNK